MRTDEEFQAAIAEFHTEAETFNAEFMAWAEGREAAKNAKTRFPAWAIAGILGGLAMGYFLWGLH